jgi:hypothetical protein
MPQLNVNGQTLDFNIGKLLNVEVIAITKTTGVPFSEFGERLEGMDYELITALVWVLRKRTEPELRYSDVTFQIDSLSFIPDEVPDPKDETTELQPSSDTDQPSVTSSDSTPGTSSG